MHFSKTINFKEAWCLDVKQMKIRTFPQKNANKDKILLLKKCNLHVIITLSMPIYSSKSYLLHKVQIYFTCYLH
jgi:hypothetical protein